MSDELVELDKLCSLAESYIENSYYRVGNRSYVWEEKDSCSDDLYGDGDIVSGECPPSDADHYSWWEIVSCEIESSEIDDRNDETGEYSVTVKAWVAVSSGDEEAEVKLNIKNIKDWVDEFEKDYFSRKERTFKTQTTWRVEYRAVFKFLPEDELTIENLKSTILNYSKPDTRTRKRFCQSLNLLSKFAGLNCDFSNLAGNYSCSSREPRNLPTDKQIQDFYYQIGNDPWRWIYGMIATYGLRNHEAFFIDLNSLKNPDHSIEITQGKTGTRKVWPLHPEWVASFDLTNPKIPDVNLNRPNTAIGNVVTRHLRRNQNMPFKVYDLRHAWAVRSLEYGIEISLAAKQMGHGLQVHSNLYHSWISQQAHQRAFELAINKSDRPLPPLL